MASESPLAVEDRALLERVAARVVALRMEVPAVLTLESLTPMNLIASQALVFFEPMVLSLLRLPEYRRFAALMERRDALELLARMVENQADAAREARSAARARRAP